ncbi:MULTISPECIES: Lar family restriction alleviation protein [Acetobacter]|uniref:Lar family restriction alleviation protein n=1 Tax=Acetobacter TaxID=434 RepID=UPI00111FB30B|nr:Lar family restriction alleviation protein [Acetobacter tropicalis]
MSEELQPCPFCGAIAERCDIGEEEPQNVGGSVISCTKCLCSTRVFFGEKEGLYEAWNTRVGEKI